MSFTFDKPCLRLYNYYFFGIEKPIVIQAYNKIEARQKIDKVKFKLPAEYHGRKVIGETVIIPSFGVTERTENGKVFLWVGREYSSTGWMPREIFLKKFPE